MASYLQRIINTTFYYTLNVNTSQEKCSVLFPDFARPEAMHGLLLLSRWFLDCKRFEIVLGSHFVAGIFTKFEVETGQTTFPCSQTENFPRRGARLSNLWKVSKRDKFRIYSANSGCYKEAKSPISKFLYKRRKIMKKGKVTDPTRVYRATN